MSYLKVIEGFGVVAGLNDSNKVENHVSISIVEGEYSAREYIGYFSVYDAYYNILCNMRSDARKAKKNDYACGMYFFELENVRDIHVLRDYCESGRDCGHYAGTIEQRKAEQKETRRLELESAAKQIAAQFKMKLSSLEFIAKLEEMISEYNDGREQWNNPEVRAEEWAAHSYAGNRDSYYDDLNYVNDCYQNNISEVYNILEWLQNECPLLWAKYEESKLK